MTIKKIFAIKNILIAFAVGWLLFSLAYIGYDQFKKFEFRKLQQGYQSGAGDTIKTLMEQSKTCQPITLFEGEKEIKIISLDCLSKQKPQEKSE